MRVLDGRDYHMLTTGVWHPNAYKAARILITSLSIATTRIAKFRQE